MVIFMSKIPSIRLVLTLAGLVAGLSVAQTSSSLVLAQSDNRAITIAQPVKSQHTGRDQRVALIIGNGEYQAGNPLRNPPNDAMDVATAFRELGFSEVIVETDATLREMDSALDRFSQALGSGSIGVFYYAGHGIQSEGENYLIPVDATIDVEQDLRYEALPLGKIMGRMEDAGNDINIVILDASRNNPFGRSWRSTGTVGGGLATVDTTEGALIAYATSPGNVAADGDGRNGTFTAALLEHLREPGLDVELMLKRVRATVKTKTEERQIPWTSSSLVGDFSFNPSSNAGSSPVSRPATLEVATAPRSTPPLTTNAVPKSPETIAAMPLSNGTASTGDETISISTATRRGDRYSLEGRAGQQVEISATSEAFDTYLILQNDRGEGLAEDDDGGDGNNSSLSVTLPSNGTYQVIVSSYEEGSTGAYEIRLDGTTQSGNLQANAPLWETRYVKQGDRYAFQGRAGEEVQIRLDSPDFDPYLMLQNAAGETIAENDDSEGTYNSLLNFVFPETGTYDAIVTSYAGGVVGQYNLRVNATEIINPPLLQPAGSRMEEGERIVARNLMKRGDRYAIQGEANQMLQISLGSPDFDTYLILQNAAGEVIAESDDSTNGTDSFLETTLPAAGNYNLIATAFTDESVGNYQLSATELQRSYRPILPLQPGSLDEADETISTQYVQVGDSYSFQGQVNQKIEISMDSSEFDTYLMLQNGAGETIATNDDDGEGSNALLNTVLPETGSYRIIATAYAPESTGAYRLGVNELQLVNPSLLQQTAALEATDPVIPVPESTKRGDRYTFRGQAGQRVEISLTSTDFDPYLILQNEAGETIFENDDREGSNSLIQTLLPASGTYTIVATGYNEESLGTYNLTLQEANVTQVIIPATNDRLDPSERLVTRTLNRRGDRYQITGEAGQEIEVSLSSDIFDAYLILQNAKGESIAENDDGDGSHSVLNAVLPETGTYDLIATGYNIDAIGAYNLKADTVQRDDRSILQTTSAQLSSEDESITSIYTRQGDRHTFSGKAGQNILINLESDDFDTFVIVQNERGETIAENDDTEGSNSTIRVTLPENGTYQVLATTFNEGSMGAYRLIVQEQRILTPAILEVTEGKLGN